eukprot:7945472-Alexandrium_andersonii.AAC.1
MDLSAYVRFRFLPAPVPRVVARRGVLPGPRRPASLTLRIEVVQREMRDLTVDGRCGLPRPGR